MKHQYTYTFFNVNKTVFEFFSVSHLTEEMVKCYTIQQHLPTITYEFQTNLKYCVQQTHFKYKLHMLATEHNEPGMYAQHFNNTHIQER